MFTSIKTKEDIKNFLDKTNSLHDGYIISVKYANNGIKKFENVSYLNPEQTKLIIQIMVTSICDTIVEIEFENLLEWQIKDNQFEITDTSIIFNNQNCIVWADDVYLNMDELKKGSYAIAKSMKWRIIEKDFQKKFYGTILPIDNNLTIKQRRCNDEPIFSRLD